MARRSESGRVPFHNRNVDDMARCRPCADERRVQEFQVAFLVRFTNLSARFHQSATALLVSMYGGPGGNDARVFDDL